MVETKMAKTVTNILWLSPTHFSSAFVTNIDVTSYYDKLHFWSISTVRTGPKLHTRRVWTHVITSFGSKIMLPYTSFARYECIERSIHVINQKCVISWVTEVAFWFWFLVEVRLFWSNGWSFVPIQYWIECFTILN